MASLPVRDPIGDHLLTPKNAALAVIDYQPSQFAGIRSIDQDLLLENLFAGSTSAATWAFSASTSGCRSTRRRSAASTWPWCAMDGSPC